MYLPKKDIYDSLKTLNYFVAQTQPTVFNDLPAIIFRVGDNSVETDLDNNIISQEMDIIIDIWAEDSVTTSKILSEIEHLMRQNLYNMSFSSDIPNPGNLFHINSRFSKKI